MTESSKSRFSERTQHNGVESGFDSFEPFPRLPIEIRLLIWTLTLLPPQLQGPCLASPSYLQCRCPISHTPITLRITHESRSLALQHLTPRDPVFLSHWQTRDGSPYASHVDFTNDVFVYPHAHFYRKTTPIRPYVMLDGEILESEVEGKIGNQFFSKEEQGMVRHLRLETYRVEEGGNDIVEWVREYLPFFKSLKRLVFVAVFKPGMGSGRYMYRPKGLSMVQGSLDVEGHIGVLNHVLEGEMRKYGEMMVEEGVPWVAPKFEVVVNELEGKIPKPPRPKGLAYQSPAAIARARSAMIRGKNN